MEPCIRPFRDRQDHRWECLLLSPWAGGSADGLELLGLCPFRISRDAAGSVSCWVPVPAGVFMDYSWEWLEPNIGPFQVNPYIIIIISILR